MCHIGTSLSDHRAVTRANRERATRIELAFSAWEADVLPLNYARERLEGSRVPKLGLLPVHDGEPERGLVKSRPNAPGQKVQ
jgi:hypothetical protein